MEVDSKLQSQVDAGESPIDAVFSLRNIGVAPSATIRRRMEQVVKSAEQAAGSRIEVLNTFENLGYFVVRAKPEIISELLKSDALSSAIANQQ